MSIQLQLPSLDSNCVREMLEDSGAILTGHFVLSGGEHSDLYIEKTRALRSSAGLKIYCKNIAINWLGDGIEVVIGPAIAGIQLATMVAVELHNLTGRNILAVFTEKDENGKQKLKRGKEDIKGKRVLVVDDIVTTGGSLTNVINQCPPEATIIGCQVLVDRSGSTITPEMLGVRDYRYLLKLDITKYLEEKCPLCKKQIPINTDFGHGREFLEKNPEKAQ